MFGGGIQRDTFALDNRIITFVDEPTGAKQIYRLWKHVVVYYASINREQSHKQDNVATTEKYVPYLINTRQIH